MNPTDRVRLTYMDAPMSHRGKALTRAERFRLTIPSTRRSTLLSGKRHKPRIHSLSSYRRFDNTNRCYSLLRDVHVHSSGFHSSENTLSLCGTDFSHSKSAWHRRMATHPSLNVSRGNRVSLIPDLSPPIGVLTTRTAVIPF